MKTIPGIHLVTDSSWEYPQRPGEFVNLDPISHLHRNIRICRSRDERDLLYESRTDEKMVQQRISRDQVSFTFPSFHWNVHVRRAQLKDEAKFRNGN